MEQALKNATKPFIFQAKSHFSYIEIGIADACWNRDLAMIILNEDKISGYVLLS